MSGGFLDLDDLAELYNSYGQELTFYIAKHYSPSSEAADILQEVFYLAARSISKGKVKADSPRTWLYRITRNLLISKYRQNGRRVNSVFEGDINYESFEEKLIDDMLLDSIFKFVKNNCSAREIEVFELRIIHEMDYKQIAEVVNSSKSSIARMVQNIIAKIEAEFSEKRDKDQK